MVLRRRSNQSKMFNLLYVAIVVAFVKYIHCQGYVDSPCTLKSTGDPGICKLLNDCPPAVQGLKQKRYPQTCGFQQTQPLVCCPQEKNKPPQRKSGEVSKSKCREYAAYAYVTVRSPISLINAKPITRYECGHKVVKLIVGGKPAGRKEFPHMAAIGFESTPGNVQYLCGGTMISSEYILTAAHCLSAYSQGDAKWVKLGVTLQNDTSNRQEIKVAERIAYPEYRPGVHYHDIGLIKLEHPATLNPFARPACLYLTHDITGEQAIATGWGQTSWDGPLSNILLKVTLDLFDHAFCNSSYKNEMGRRLSNGIVDDIQLCAGSIDKEKDTCMGDSGGPLQIYHIDDEIRCMYDIVGVTSFGKGCSNSPGVYVRVSHYIKWIEDIVWPQS